MFGEPLWSTYDVEECGLVFKEFIGGLDFLNAACTTGFGDGNVVEIWQQSKPVRITATWVGDDGQP